MVMTHAALPNHIVIKIISRNAEPVANKNINMHDLATIVKKYQFEALTRIIVTRAQAVGWPPVRSYRRNVMTVQSVKSKKEEEPEKQQSAANAGGNGSAFVKVSMDGAPYLRKVDLKMYNSYTELSVALKKMFSTFTTSGKSHLPCWRRNLQSIQFAN
jgi:hypothetical protein